MSKKIKYSIIIILTIITYIISLMFYINYKVETNYLEKIKTIKEIKTNKVGLVLWAWVKNWQPSDIYKDRLTQAINAYKNNKIKVILISWDNWNNQYDEITPAKNYLYNNNVNKEDIFLDYAWFDTYDSLYRAKEIFQIKELTIFTQEFHLKRALYICDWLKIDCMWVKTDLHIYKNSKYYSLREFFSRFKAFLNINLKSKPKFLWEKINLNWKSNYE